MGSDGNQLNDGTGFQPSEPKLCANGCSFFGAAATMNLCSKCFRDLRIREEQAASAKAAMDKLVHQAQTAVDGFSLEPRVGSTSLIGEPSQPAAVSEPTGLAEPKAAGRCLSCRKKVGPLGFKCRCGSTFCGDHRYPEKHDCSFDYKAAGRDALAKDNPVVKADKLDRI